MIGWIFLFGGVALRMVGMQPAKQASFECHIGQKQYWTSVQIWQLQETFGIGVMFPDKVILEILRLKVKIQGWDPFFQNPASQGAVPPPSKF